MLETRRKHKRFKSPLGIKFRPTYGAIEYSTADAVDLSCNGLRLDAHDFKFIHYENLELIVDMPGGRGEPVSLYGYVVWKKQTGQRCLAGIKFRMQDERMQREAVETIFFSLGVPQENIYNIAPDYMKHDNEEIIDFSETRAKNKKPPGPPNKLGFIKRYYEGGNKCKVTFRLLREMADNSQIVTIVGDFNDWNTSQSQMTRLENGDFVVTLDLDSKREYRFRYLIDGNRWENDLYADKFVRNNHGSKDSVVIV